MQAPIPVSQNPIHDPLKPSTRVPAGPGLTGEKGYRAYPPVNMAIDHAMCELLPPYIYRPEFLTSLLHAPSNPCKTFSTDWDRKTESVDLGNVMVPGDILQFEGMYLERMAQSSSTSLTWRSIITRQEHIQFYIVYWILHTPRSPDGRPAYHQGVPDLWCIIRFYSRSSIIKFPLELLAYLCAVFGSIAWAACLGIFVLPGAPISRFLLSIGIGVVSEVATLVVWNQWLGYPIKVPLRSVVRLCTQAQSASTVEVFPKSV
ncbi:uncharacterized protein LACBIDRAFT_334808 [Laccaria bicolor S238N-H82]|uniref:Predicted protein n=1 Tax=Laccaria bicolor (strain S238N-H82 / ATCC MYA-4686) TaxID=486041 RepID=B0E0D9_LACBS|nr:uncharacterized protein LACBIDRAFT_334808 [Laccaria bicolor S238N-H82]EDQ99668.1 predicted protein [Laccaria bicolor S238N-H82]|eukprot:XP_001889645.1 predicted protein [Laccaria bicolor S238N-H82]